MEYHYSTKQFGISDEGVHFLRNRFEYKKLPFSSIEKIELKKGMQLNNWAVILAIGVALISTTTYLTLGILKALEHPGYSFRAFRIVYLLFIPFIGGYFIYEALQYGLVLEVNYEGKKIKRFHLRRLTPESRQKFSEYLATKIGNKFVNRLYDNGVRSF